MSDQPTTAKSNEKVVTASQTAPESTPQREAEMHRRYLEQQRRMRCVGCGEAEEYF